ncbi:MAG TPA: histidine phosphatase family protein [Candidatus Limnocylindrales bacterium]|nr:histidine phosphatase family protein [Candidatus Limnocylindrales bacterium]
MSGGPLVPEGLDATLVLVRHGESEAVRENRFQGQLDSPLSAVGLRQAQLVGERFRDQHASPALPIPGGPPRQIVWSPLQRARATALAIGDAIADAHGIDPARGLAVPFEGVEEPGLLEIHQGEWQGVTHEEIGRRWPEELSGWRRRPWAVWAPGGESPADVQARVRPTLKRVLERLGEDYPRGTLDRPQVAGYPGVGGAHDQPWSILVGHEGVFKVVMLTLFDLPLERFWMFTMALTGITVVELRGGRPVLKAANLTEHLAPLLDEAAREAADRRSRSGAL